MDFIFEQIRVGGDRNFGYLLGDRSKGEAVVVDPSYSPGQLVDRAEAQGLKIKWIYNTHSHHDHTNGNEEIASLTGAKLTQEPVLGLQLIPVPGHTDDHVVIWHEKFGVALTGDHLFVGKIGGTGSQAAAKEQYDSFQKMYQLLPDETTIWPGHDVGVRPSSTLRIERATNPFLLAPDLEAFCELKADWATFKAQHGLS